ncbi:hypothetical protein RN001_015782 [Aquatica leii]|uniref:Uncharacterized protein n=1 Tax=Aquatica leii TaxID=1421715 RepID=A0AAN7NZF7_9COLE|nr:hypothetical protein RN001_015782 [Aquatica leii]
MAKENIDFNNTSLIRHNQDLEEAEELEERKRRDEEVHNLLSHAMGQFNFDEQSTLNSSITSNEGENSIIHNNRSLREYREANLNDQLKTLYDVRVREVESLNKDIDKLKKEFSEQQTQLKKQLTLMEAEYQRKNISLTESQHLLVEKTELIIKLNEELNILKTNVQKLEHTMKESQEENEVLRQLNMELEKQILITQKGFPLLSNTVDKEFQESQRVKIQQLEHALQQAHEEIINSNSQHKKLQEELKRNIADRDNDILEKTMFINALSNENHNLQQQSQEYTKIIEEQKSKLDLTNTKGQHLEEELRKFKEKRQITEELREVIWKEAREEFQSQLSSINLENQKLKEQLNIAKIQNQELQFYVERTSCLEIKNSDLEDKYEKLQGKYNQVNNEVDVLSKKLTQSEEEKNLLQEQHAQLLADSQLLKALKIEKETLQEKIAALEVNTSLDERGLQTSLPFVGQSEFIHLQEQLAAAHGKINKLENQIKLLQDDNSKLQIKIGLEQERETLIKELQQKAAKFEKMIQQKQQNDTSQKASVGVNTVPESDTSLLKVKHDTLLYQSEAKLHKKLKKEFDEKLVKAIIDYNTLHKCKECKSLQEEITKLTEMRQYDREAVVKLITMWEQKFEQFEKETENEKLQLFTAKAKSENSLMQMKLLLNEYMEKYKKIQENLEKHKGPQFESQKEKLLMQNKENYTVIFKHLNRITGKILNCNKEMREAEKKFEDYSKLAKD